MLLSVVGDDRPAARPRWRGALLLGLGVAVLGLLVVTIGLGSTPIPLADVVRAVTGRPTGVPSWAFIVRELRIPKAITATLGGAALAVAGLLMQTLFRNPLADPQLLGVNAGASLGASAFVLGGSGTLGGALPNAAALADVGLVAAAAVGAGLAMAVMLAVGAAVRSATVVVIIGVLVTAFVQALVQVLVFYAQPDAVKAYQDWTAGSFQGVDWAALPVLAVVVGAGLAVAFGSVKRLNAFLLGEEYAESLGVSVRRLRWTVMIGASLLAGTVTAYSGPIAFLGIAAPHLARGLFRTADHRVLGPGAALVGAALALAATVLSQPPGADHVLPLNAALALLGTPVVAWVLLRLARTGRAVRV